MQNKYFVFKKRKRRNYNLREPTLSAERQPVWNKPAERESCSGTTAVCCCEQWINAATTSDSLMDEFYCSVIAAHLQMISISRVINVKYLAAISHRLERGRGWGALRGLEPDTSFWDVLTSVLIQSLKILQAEVTFICARWTLMQLKCYDTLLWYDVMMILF